MSATVSTSTVGSTTTGSSAAAPTATGTLRVERGHRTAWVVAGSAALLAVMATAGAVVVRAGSPDGAAQTAGTAVARTDALESAHGQGTSIRTAAGPAVVVAAAPVALAPSAAVQHRMPPRGMLAP